jgi:hypothetical protein
MKVTKGILNTWEYDELIKPRSIVTLKRTFHSYKTDDYKADNSQILTTVILTSSSLSDSGASPGTMYGLCSVIVSFCDEMGIIVLRDV